MRNKLMSLGTICLLASISLQPRGLSQCRVVEPEIIKLENTEDAEDFIKKTEQDRMPKRFKMAEYQKCYNILKNSKAENDPIRQKALYYLARSQTFHASIDANNEADYTQNLEEGILNYSEFLNKNTKNKNFEKEIDLAEFELAKAYLKKRNFEESKKVLLQILKTSNKDKSKQERAETLLCNLYALTNDSQKEKFYEKATGIIPRSKEAKYIPDGVIPISDTWDANVKELFVFEKRDKALAAILKKTNGKESFRLVGPIKDILVCKQSASDPVLFVLCRSLYNSETNKTPDKGHLFKITTDGRFLFTGDNIIDQGDQFTNIFGDDNSYLLKTNLANVDGKEINMIELQQCDEKANIIFAGYSYPRKNIEMSVDKKGADAKITVYDNKNKQASISLKNGEWISDSEKIRVFTARSKITSPEGVEYEKENFASSWDPVRKDLADK